VEDAGEHSAAVVVVSNWANLATPSETDGRSSGEGVLLTLALRLDGVIRGSCSKFFGQSCSFKLNIIALTDSHGCDSAV